MRRFFIFRCKNLLSWYVCVAFLYMDQVFAMILDEWNRVLVLEDYTQFILSELERNVNFLFESLTHESGSLWMQHASHLLRLHLYDFEMVRI